MKKHHKLYLISDLKILQGIPLFQVVAAILEDTSLLFGLQTSYIW